MFSIKFITIYIVNRCPENQDFRTFSGHFQDFQEISGFSAHSGHFQEFQDVACLHSSYQTVVRTNNFI